MLQKKKKIIKKANTTKRIFEVFTRIRLESETRSLFCHSNKSEHALLILEWKKNSLKIESMLLFPKTPRPPLRNCNIKNFLLLNTNTPISKQNCFSRDFFYRVNSYYISNILTSHSYFSNSSARERFHINQKRGE